MTNYDYSNDVKSDAVLRRERKLAGVKFDGVMCSATGDDQAGLLAAENYLEKFGRPTKFKFSNGNELLLTQENFADFASIWIPFRASFFE